VNAVIVAFFNIHTYICTGCTGCTHLKHPMCSLCHWNVNAIKSCGGNLGKGYTRKVKEKFTPEIEAQFYSAKICNLDICLQHPLQIKNCC
jgi:hypothetical protein